MSEMLEVKGLGKSYATFHLSDVTFSLPYGYIMGFIGQNGAGKTTTIKLILGAIQADAGSVKLFGASSGDGAGNQANPNERIGVVLDTPLYIEDWTVDDVERAVSPFYARWDAGRFASLRERFRLERKAKVKDLSRGMKVKLQIAVALCHGAELLILDEPTSGLDPVAREEVCDLLQEFVGDEGRSVLFSTHITSDLERVADYITYIRDGSIVYTGTKDELLGRYVRVAGGLDELDAAQRGLIIGYRGHAVGFEGIAAASDLSRLPGGLVIDPVSLDDIILGFSKEV